MLILGVPAWKTGDTYASWLVQQGENIKTIQELLGHVNIQTTMVYTHIAKKNKESAASKVEAILQKMKLDKTTDLPFLSLNTRLRG